MVRPGADFTNLCFVIIAKLVESVTQSANFDSTKFQEKFGKFAMSFFASVCVYSKAPAKVNRKFMTGVRWI